jgi:hypothetical protein
VRVLPHITKLDDCFGDFLVRVTCPCGTSRHIEPEALARIAGRSATFVALAERMRCSQCWKKRRRSRRYFPSRASVAEDSPVERATSATSATLESLVKR